MNVLTKISASLVKAGVNHVIKGDSIIISAPKKTKTIAKVTKSKKPKKK